MSIESVKNFYEKIANDKDFQKKLDELQSKTTEGLELPLAQDKKEEIIKDVIIPFAKEQGFDFSIEDIKKFEQSIIEQLDEKQLENIAAGSISEEHGGIGLGLNFCKVVGFGVLGNFGPYSFGLCLLIGFGTGIGACILFGNTFEIED